MKKLQTILTILAVISLPLMSVAGPWQMSVDFHNANSGKARLISIISPGFEKEAATADIVGGKCTFSFTNEDEQLHIFRIAVDNDKFTPTFFASNNDKLTLDYTDATDATYAGNTSADVYKNYMIIQKKETADQEVFVKAAREHGSDSAELKLITSVNKNKLAESANRKITLIQSINDPVLSSYLAYKEVYAIKTGNIDLYDKYHSALGKKAQDTFWGKYVNDVVNNFEAYQLLRQTKMIKPEEAKERYNKLPQAQKNSTFGRDLARELGI
jgi:hypothetical protein